MGITAFGVNGVVYPPGHPGVHHYHDTQDELYFVHSGTAKVEVGGEERILGPGGLFHVESTTPRRIANVGDEELVMLVVGGKGGYVERDGHVMSEEDLKVRQGLSGVGSTEPHRSGGAGSAGTGAGTSGVGSTEPHSGAKEGS
jgi:mannose-6-phosphate isomerase-like protein (cupin superfamily)